ncbi:hypothetical protein [Desulfitibacter alkalitolerans]|uniref:hypothetical protein n=1 Tax=Desulfitibacter alkalitolerans TaxID=264641 RepID=UPI00054E59E4|nr:hypothetical protein [Desulfitibacter alkalitolerans]
MPLLLAPFLLLYHPVFYAHPNIPFMVYSVDRLPFIKQPEKLDYKQLLCEYKSQHGKELKPVKSRGDDNPVPLMSLAIVVVLLIHIFTTILVAVVSSGSRSVGYDLTRIKRIQEKNPNLFSMKHLKYKYFYQKVWILFRFG